MFTEDEEEEKLRYLDVGVKRWIAKAAYKNHWKVSSYYDIDDLIQDGYLCYQKCVEKYKRLLRKRKPKKSDQRNFMALVQTTFENHITDLAKHKLRRFGQKEIPVSQLIREGSQFTETDLFDRAIYRDQGSDDPTISEAIAYYHRLPTLTRKVLKGVLRDMRKGKRVTVEEINARLCKAWGNENSVDKVSELYDILGIDRPRDRNSTQKPKVTRLRLRRVSRVAS